MANGTTKPISEVREGDYVYATDPETGESGAREVIATLPHTDQLLTLRTSSGEIVTTGDHKYWNASDEQWQESQDLDEGDRLLSADGDMVTVEGLDWSTLHTAPAFDLDVAGIDTYYVGAGDDAVLVHNADRCVTGEALSALRRQFDNTVKPAFWRNEATTSAGRWSADDLANMRQGRAPIGSDGYPMELHHRTPLSQGGSNDPSNLQIMTRTEHRLGGNYSTNHPR